ncbi:MAG: NDP-sugar synthase [Elusimicrobiota bacterium]
MNAIVLAAGLGTRMRPLSERLPKPLLPVAGVPLLARIIGGLGAARRVVVNTHHLPERIAVFTEGLAEKERVLLSHEPEILGSGGALVKARAVLAEDDIFIYHNADELTDFAVARAVSAHRGAGSPLATLVVQDSGPENKVLVSAQGEVLDIAGRRGVAPPAGSRLRAFIGIAVMSRRLFELLPQRERFCSVMEALLKGISAAPGCVCACAADGAYWRNIEDVGRYLDVHREILSEGLLRFPEVPRGPVQVCAGAEVDPGAELSGFVSVCRGARIEAGARLRDCVVLDGAHIGAGAVYAAAVVGDGFACRGDRA